MGALYFLDQVVTKRALAVVGDSALETYPDDPEGGWLTQPWVSACSCLNDIALVAGAPETITSAERASLMR